MLRQSVDRFSGPGRSKSNMCGFFRVATSFRASAAEFTAFGVKHQPQSEGLLQTFLRTSQPEGDAIRFLKIHISCIFLCKLTPATTICR